MTFRTITESEARAILANEDAAFLPFQAVNEAGLREIQSFLADNHKLGGDHFTADMLRAWAADAKFQLGEGNGASIEIKSVDSIHGHTQEYTLSPAGVEWQVCE